MNAPDGAGGPPEALQTSKRGFLKKPAIPRTFHWSAAMEVVAWVFVIGAIFFAIVGFGTIWWKRPIIG